MDYKEKYEQAIEALRSLFAEQAIKHCDRVNIKDITNIFPELKESEDERIRKGIYNFLYNERHNIKQLTPYTDEFDRWLAWLEKQGEHKKFRDSIQVGDKVTRNEDGVLVNLSQLKRVAKKDEKQGEKKPDWSEEDDGMLQTVINRLELSKNGVASEILYVERCVDWLKSLRPQNTWKPSEKEIVALEHAMNCYSGISPTNTEEVYTLEIMKEQLKKLREEDI